MRHVLLWWLFSLCAVAGPKASTTYVLITVDTETSAGCGPQACIPESIEARILGQQGESYYGVPKIMTMVEHHGMAATFFVNAYLGAAYPEDQITDFVQSIVKRGHDVEFHSHEDFRCFRVCKNDDLACRQECSVRQSFLLGNTYDNQLAILDEGAQAIARWSGQRPIAFRGGAYKADAETLRALRTLGISYDMSLSGPEHNLAALFHINKVAEASGTVEIPLFNFDERILWSSRTKHLDINSTTFPEMKSLITDAVDNDVKVIVLMMHSFSFCDLHRACPAVDVIDRFEHLLSYLRGQPGIRVVTVRQLADIYSKNKAEVIGSGYVPHTGYWLTLYRSAARFDEGGMNRAFLLANAAVLALLMLLAFYAVRAFRVRRLRRNGRF